MAEYAPTINLWKTRTRSPHFYGNFATKFPIKALNYDNYHLKCNNNKNASNSELRVSSYI